jgi:hypothetical protein
MPTVTDDEKPRTKVPKSRLAWDLGSLIVLGGMLLCLGLFLGVIIAVVLITLGTSFLPSAERDDAMLGLAIGLVGWGTLAAVAFAGERYFDAYAAHHGARPVFAFRIYFRPEAAPEVEHRRKRFLVALYAVLPLTALGAAALIVMAYGGGEPWTQLAAAIAYVALLGAVSLRN